MPGEANKYVWRCAKCSNHFSNIANMDGMIKQEKKCPKCKSLNVLTYLNKEIYIQCKFSDENIHEYISNIEENF